jgi:hypothetical protein
LLRETRTSAETKNNGGEEKHGKQIKPSAKNERDNELRAQMQKLIFY